MLFVPMLTNSFSTISQELSETMKELRKPDCQNVEAITVLLPKDRLNLMPSLGRISFYIYLLYFCGITNVFQPRK